MGVLVLVMVMVIEVLDNPQTKRIRGNDDTVGEGVLVMVIGLLIPRPNAFVATITLMVMVIKVFVGAQTKRIRGNNDTNGRG